MFDCPSQALLASLGTLNAFTASALLAKCRSLDVLLGADVAARQALQKQLALQVRCHVAWAGPARLKSRG